MISPAKFQPSNPSIKASKCISRFWSFGRFVWNSKKLPNFFFSINFSFFCFGYLKVRHVEFSSNFSLVWMKIEFLETSSVILYGKITRSRISRNRRLKFCRRYQNEPFMVFLLLQLDLTLPKHPNFMYILPNGGFKGEFTKQSVLLSANFCRDFLTKSWLKRLNADKSQFCILFEPVTFKMTHFTFANMVTHGIWPLLTNAKCVIMNVTDSIKISFK